MWKAILYRSFVLVAAVALALTSPGCPRPGVPVPDVVGLTQAAAETAITDAGLVLGTVTEELSDTVAAGNVISQNPAAGARLAAGGSVALVVSKGSLVEVQGRILFDDGTPVEGAEIAGAVASADLLAVLRQAMQAEEAMADYNHPDNKLNDALVRSYPSLIASFLLPEKQTEVTTGADGVFTFEIVVPSLPARVLANVEYDATPLPLIETAKWEETADNALDFGDIVIPNPEGTEMAVTAGTAQTADASIVVDGLPGEVEQLFGRTYDPDVSPEAFPGEFAEMGAIPLNSSVFLWMEALDAAGNPVDEFDQAATIRARIPQTQWVDLEDIESGTDRIEIPIYTFDETTNMWEQEGIGWVEDAGRTVLPEDAQSVILDGTFAGDLYATFTTNHLSWMNVDYAYIGPWTLSRMDRAQRNNDCLYNAMQLASKIAKSQKGHDAYARVNQAGANLDTELGDAMGPELKNEALADDYGVYEGDSGGSETQFKIAEFLWNGCGDGATEEQKKNTTLLMAVTILHETAHWKDDVKKHPDDDTDTEGEEGNQLEKDLFGGILTGDGSGVKREGAAVDNATRDGWLNGANWPAPAGGTKRAAVPVAKADVLDVAIAVPEATVDLGEEIPVEVTYTNTSGAPIQVMNRVVLEGWPLHFNIVNQTTGDRVRFLGPEVKLNLTDNDFSTLNPGATLVQTVNLLRDPTSSAPRYQLITSGGYDITAVYEGMRGVDEAVSNTVSVIVAPGGSISGIVANATNGLPLPGGVVRALVDDFVLATATVGLDGTFTVPELPGGTYTLEAQTSGFLRSRREDVVVTTGQNTVVNFNLSPLLALGELRIVLTWGDAPGDLDSHLWLPMETPYHVYYGRRASLDLCPFASLDTDDTSAFGPETMTIRQRFLEGTYVYAIFNYSGSPALIESQAQVQVFDATGLIATFDVPAVGEGRWWHVLNVDGATGGITEVNQIVGTSPEPYTDTDQGCAPPVK